MELQWAEKKFHFGQASMLSGRFVWLLFPQYHVAFLFQIRSSYRQVPFLYVLLYTLKDKNSHFCAFQNTKCIVMIKVYVLDTFVPEIISQLRINEKTQVKNLFEIHLLYLSCLLGTIFFRSIADFFQVIGHVIVIGLEMFSICQK